MPLLDDDLRARLLPLYSQEAEDEPMVFARFFLPGTYTAWFVIDGQPDGDDFVFFGFVTRPENKFAEFRLSQLEGLVGANGQRVERDLTFRGGRLTEVVPAPDL